MTVRMRSKLFVPGCRVELFSKAAASAADALSFDLEDSVPAARKAEARASVAAFVGSGDAGVNGKVVVVRTNALDSGHFVADLGAIVVPGVHLVNVPKVESVDDVLAAVAHLEQAERAAGIESPINLLVNIETPRALRLAASIAAAHPRVAGLQVGLGDMFEPHGISRHAANLHAVLYSVRMAAAEAGVFACDGAFPDFSNASGFRVEAQMARDLGYAGKSCIHPSQVALANEIFSPSEDETTRARRIVEAAREARARGLEAFAVDGRMIDPPFLRRAEAILLAAGEPAR